MPTLAESLQESAVSNGRWRDFSFSSIKSTGLIKKLPVCLDGKRAVQEQRFVEDIVGKIQNPNLFVHKLAAEVYGRPKHYLQCLGAGCKASVSIFIAFVRCRLCLYG
jgi:hypothetical protein